MRSDLNKTSEVISMMFSSIAPKYDLMNDIMTGFTHKRTRKYALELLNIQKNETLLDLASGTGDFALLAKRSLDNNTIYAIDFSEGMLEQAIHKEKYSKKDVKESINFITSDITFLPFVNESMDICSICYGIRNVEDPNIILKEIARVTKKKLLIIESTVPTNPLIRYLITFYFKKVVPVIAKVFSSNASAYNYYFKSVEHFLPPLELIKVLKKSKWKTVTYQNLFLGAVTIYLATK